MDAKMNNCGPAFPTMRGEVGGVDGMSLRQWYAGHAGAAMIAGYGIENLEGNPKTFTRAAAAAFAFADAMIAAEDRSHG